MQKKLTPHEKQARFMVNNPAYAPYQIGAWTYGAPRVYTWNKGATLKIGKFCSIAGGVKIYLDGEHRTDWVTTYPFSYLFEKAAHIEGHPKSKGDVVIGNDVWIASDVMILSGVTIGDGAVVGSRSVVSRDIAPYAIAAGNPATHISNRFSDEAIAELLRIAWWNWPDDKIEEAFPQLLSEDIEAFIARHRQS